MLIDFRERWLRERGRERNVDWLPLHLPQPWTKPATRVRAWPGRTRSLPGRGPRSPRRAPPGSAARLPRLSHGHTNWCLSSWLFIIRNSPFSVMILPIPSCLIRDRLSRLLFRVDMFYFLHPLTLNISLSLYIKCVRHKLHLGGSYLKPSLHSRVYLADVWRAAHTAALKPLVLFPSCLMCSFYPSSPPGLIKGFYLICFVFLLPVPFCTLHYLLS